MTDSAAKSLLWRLMPSSLIARLLIVMVAGISTAQIVTSVIWAGQVSSDARQSLSESVRFLALSMASTVQYFSALPDNVRPIVLDQQREIGGSRYFLNLNQHPIELIEQVNHSLSALVINEVNAVLADELGVQDVQSALVMPDQAIVFPNGTRLTDLPDRWIRQSLALEPRPAPLLVSQVKLRDGSWMYIATLLPDPYILDKTRALTGERWLSLLLSLLIVGILSVWFVRWQAQPLANLAAAADAFGRGMDHAPLQDSGLRELDATARAFGVMESRIQRYMTDRERLFGAISHDLRTPITRLKLRTELLEDGHLQQEFNEDLDELELMVKGALQSVRDSDIHEDPHIIDLPQLLQKLARDNTLAGHPVSVRIASQPKFIGKPLALKRCLSNLIDNAVFYGERANIVLEANASHLVIRILDNGPGISDDDMKKLFEPYTRLAHGRHLNKNGMGLGLGIARAIIHGHGGELHLQNRPEGGLEVRLTLPLSA